MGQVWASARRNTALGTTEQSQRALRQCAAGSCRVPYSAFAAAQRTGTPLYRAFIFIGARGVPSSTPDISLSYGQAQTPMAGVVTPGSEELTTTSDDYEQRRLSIRYSCVLTIHLAMNGVGVGGLALRE